MPFTKATFVQAGVWGMLLADAGLTLTWIPLMSQTVTGLGWRLPSGASHDSGDVSRAVPAGP